MKRLFVSVAALVLTACGATLPPSKPVASPLPQPAQTPAELRRAEGARIETAAERARIATVDYDVSSVSETSESRRLRLLLVNMTGAIARMRSSRYAVAETAAARLAVGEIQRYLTTLGKGE